MGPHTSYYPGDGAITQDRKIWASDNIENTHVLGIYADSEAQDCFEEDLLMKFYSLTILTALKMAFTPIFNEVFDKSLLTLLFPCHIHKNT